MQIERLEYRMNPKAENCKFYLWAIGIFGFSFLR